MSVKALGFNKTGAVQTEAALASVLCRLLLNALLRSGRSREEKQFAVGQNTINIEKQQFNFFSARLAVWHARILAER